MHLVGPYLSTTGKRKGKKKWASSEQKRNAELLEKNWQSIKNKWGAPEKSTKKITSVDLPTYPKTYIRDTGPRPASLNSWHSGSVSSKPNQQYTGENIVGIGTLHKSNAVPVFSDQEAKDIASMRR